MLEFDPGAYFKDSIELVWAKVNELPDGDIPLWVDDQIAEIEAWEKDEGIEIVRTPAAIDHQLQNIADELLKLHESLPLDELEQTDRRRKAIQRLELAQNCLMLKGELLRRKTFAESLTPHIPRKGSRRADTRIIWTSVIRPPEEFLRRIAKKIAFPASLDIALVARAHFYCRSHPTPKPAGTPSRIRWLDDLKVLAIFFEELAVHRYIQEGQLKKVPLHFVDKEGCEINQASFLTLPHKESNQANIKVEKLINAIEKIK